MIEIELANRQSRHPIDSDRLVAGARLVLETEGVAGGVLSLAVVDDATIHDLNRRYLGHDYPTDVLSFLFDRTGDRLEGEVVVSADTAAHAAPQYGWSIGDELLLYVIHGVLHLCGYDDQTERDRQQMRQREGFYLTRLGCAPRKDAPGRDEDCGRDESREAGE